MEHGTVGEGCISEGDVQKRKEFCVERTRRIRQRTVQKRRITEVTK
jgi:hypothetical protein